MAFSRAGQLQAWQGATSGFSTTYLDLLTHITNHKVTSTHFIPSGLSSLPADSCRRGPNTHLTRMSIEHHNFMMAHKNLTAGTPPHSSAKTSLHPHAARCLVSLAHSWC